MTEKKQDRHHRGGGRRPDIVIYRTAPVVVESPWSLEDQNKLALMRLLQDARKVVMGRVNALPGSNASTELYLRFKQLESAAVDLGRTGLWGTAFEKFKEGYAQLLSAAPTGNPEPVYGTRGVGGCVGSCGGSCRSCMGCVACAAGQALADFRGLLERVRASIAGGDERDAFAMLARAKGLLPRLGPTAAAQGQIEYAAVAQQVSAMRPTSPTEVRMAPQGISGTMPGWLQETTRLTRAARASMLAGQQAAARAQLMQAEALYAANGPDAGALGELQYAREVVAANPQALADARAGRDLLARGRVNAQPESVTGSFFGSLSQSAKDAMRGGWLEDLQRKLDQATTVAKVAVAGVVVYAGYRVYKAVR